MVSSQHQKVVAEFEARRPIRLALDDDHAIMSAGLASMLAPYSGVEVVEQDGSAPANIDVLLFDPFLGHAVAMYDDERPSVERLRSWLTDNWAVFVATLLLTVLMGWAISTLF